MADAVPADEVTTPPLVALDSANELIIHRCAWLASKHLSPGLTREDLKQEGRLSLLLAARAGRLPADPEHRKNYVHRRVLGAMLDANRASWAQQPHYVDEIADDTPRAATPAPNPDRALQVQQALARFIRKATPRQLECIELLAEGHDIRSAAAVMHVDQSRVSQIRTSARELLAGHF